MIEMRNITKIYSSGGYETLALDKVDISIKEGEFVAVMGKSGSGKSTLINIIGCMDTPTDGEYKFEDIIVNRLSGRQLDEFRKEKINFVFQNFALMNQYTVYENVEVPLLARNIKKSERKRLIEDALKKVDIYEQKDKLPIHISGGQQQRAAIARAIVAKSKVIVADEPTGSLDEKNGEEIIKLFQSLNLEGLTIIIVTHDKKVAEQANRIIELSDGKIVCQQPQSLT